jgi:outer membrane protein TolC
VDVRARPVLPPLDDALRRAYAANPALVALVEEQQRLEATARSLALGRLPRISGGGTADYNTSGVLQPQGVGAGFVGFTWDLGTDGRREAQISEARIQAERNRIAIERELRELETAVRATQRAAEERLAALDTAAVAVGQAEENLRIRQQQFGAGRAATDDVLDAEAILAQQRAALATALYQAHTRRAELQQLMGLPLGATPEAN